MTIRTALERAPVIAFGLFVAFLWILIAGAGVFNGLDFANAGPVGQGAVGGVVGLAVIAVALGLIVVLFGELAEDDPRPETWPPVE